MSNEEILKAYDITFQDAVRCYAEDNNVKLSDDDIKSIAYRLIYKQEYLWEIMNECIYQEIEYLKRGN